MCVENIEADLDTVAHGPALKEERGFFLGEGRGGGRNQSVMQSINQCRSLVRQLRMLWFQV